jgi:hypothetical protein
MGRDRTSYAATCRHTTIFPNPLTLSYTFPYTFSHCLANTVPNTNVISNT